MIIQQSYVETNEFADRSKRNNGGGYHQPKVTGTVNNIPFELHNTQCGEFGKRATLIIGEFKARYDFVGRDEESSNIPKTLDNEINTLNLKYNTDFTTITR